MVRPAAKFTREFSNTSRSWPGSPLLLGALACFLGGVLSDSFIARTGNKKWGRRLFGVLGHGLAAVCYFIAIFAGDSVWLFVGAVAFAAFFNDMMMGAAWASCIDIGKRYSGVVSGCMNTVGNLGGAAAGFVTGFIIDLAKKGATSDTPQAIHEASKVGWHINFASFSAVFVIGTICWLLFDSTRPIEPEEPCETLDAPPTI
ncbi:MAG: MFS transporter [Gemmataceae bacterium]